MMTDMEILYAGRDLVYYGGCLLLGARGYLLIKGSSDFDKFFQAKKLCVKIKNKEYYPKVVNKQKTTYGYLLRIKMPVGLSSEDLIKSQVAINEMLCARTGIYFDNGYTYIKVYISNLESEYDFEQVKYKGLKLLFGYTMNGIEYIDLSKSSPHCLIAGETGSGKSTLVRSMLTNLILNNDLSNLELHLIDLKRGVEFSIFKDCNMVKSFAKDIDGATNTLQMAISECERRYDLFEENECVDIQEYNNLGKERLKRWLLVIDEFAEMTTDKENIDIICRLAAISRACGIHLLLCTQRPDKDVVNGRIKANITLVAGLKTKDSTNSRIIIDESGLESLRGQGHGLLKANGDTVEFQAMNLTPNEARRLVKPFKIKRTKAKTIIQKDIFEVFDYEAN